MLLSLLIILKWSNTSISSSLLVQSPKLAAAQRHKIEKVRYLSHDALATGSAAALSDGTDANFLQVRAQPSQEVIDGVYFLIGR